MPAPQTPAQFELAQLIVSAVNLDEVDPATIDPDAPLFGAGLGLDSIDALELALAVSKKYGFQLRSDNDAKSISAHALLFDSIDALELALEISKRYGVQLKSDDENNKRIFGSLRALSEHIAQATATATA